MKIENRAENSWRRGSISRSYSSSSFPPRLTEGWMQEWALEVRGQPRESPKTSELEEWDGGSHWPPTLKGAMSSDPFAGEKPKTSWPGGDVGASFPEGQAVGAPGITQTPKILANQCSHPSSGAPMLNYW